MPIIPNPTFKFVKGDKTYIQNTMIFEGFENVINYDNWLYLKSLKNIFDLT